EARLDRPVTSTLLATSRREHSPAWSPSGGQYAYVSDARGVPEIWLRSVAEGWARPVVAGDAEGTLDGGTPRFSPDGQRIAYARLAEQHQVWIVNVAGGLRWSRRARTNMRRLGGRTGTGSLIAVFSAASGRSPRLPREAGAGQRPWAKVAAVISWTGHHPGNA